MSSRCRVPSNWAIAVSTWIADISPSWARASDSESGIASIRRLSDSARSAAGANSRDSRTWSAVPGFHTIGSHS